MHDRVGVVAIAIVAALAGASGGARSADVRSEGTARAEADVQPQVQAAPSQDSNRATPAATRGSLPCQAFTEAPKKPHDPAALVFTFEELEHWYRVPGEFTHRLNGDQYGFETLSFIVSETHPGGGPGLHVHDTEEAHVLLRGTARYRIGDKTFTVEAPYVAKVPAGVPHTFINAGTEPFNLVAVFGTKHPTTTRVGPNPLVILWEGQHAALPCTPAK